MVLLKRDFNKYFFIFPCMFFIPLLICFRSDDFRDYQNYYNYFKYGYEGVEVSYKIISTLLRSVDNGFYYLLYLYGFLGFSLKFYRFYEIYAINYGFFRFLLVLSMYFCCFFVLWDLIQIRYSAAISFLMIGFFCKNIKFKFFLFFISFLFHYSMVVPICLFIFLVYFKNNFTRFLFFILFPIFGYFLIGYSEYALRYSSVSSDYDQSIPIFSGIYFLNFFMIIVFIFFKDKVSENYREISLDIFWASLILMVLCMVISPVTPEGANRYISLLTFQLLMLFSLIKNRLFSYLYFVFVVFFCFWYLKIYIWKEDGLIPFNGLF